jgi:hypothetical protein
MENRVLELPNTTIVVKTIITFWLLTFLLQACKEKFGEA